MRGRLIVGVIALIALFSACASDDGSDETGAQGSGSEAEQCPEDYQGADIYPVFISSEITAGEGQRFLVGLLDSNDAPFSSDAVEMRGNFEPVEGGEGGASTDFSFIETVPSQDRGVYVGYPSFDAAGTWAVEISVSGDGVDEELRGCFEVTDKGTTPAIGAKAPASDVPTIADVNDLGEISTDDDPNPRFYQVTPAQALKKRDPFVLVFATPKYCTSQVCGPTLDEVEMIVAEYPKLTVIHSEIYKDLEPTSPVVPAVEEWGLPSEPWVFVVDSDGKVVAKYEGSVSPDELQPVLDSLDI